MKITLKERNISDSRIYVCELVSRIIYTINLATNLTNNFNLMTLLSHTADVSYMYYQRRHKRHRKFEIQNGCHVSLASTSKTAHFISFSNSEEARRGRRTWRWRGACRTSGSSSWTRETASAGWVWRRVEEEECTLYFVWPFCMTILYGLVWPFCMVISMVNLHGYFVWSFCMVICMVISLWKQVTLVILSCK